MMDLDKILNIRQANLPPTRGRVLISNPFLSDYFFKRSVVLLVDHGSEGSFGVIVNKPLDVKLNQITKEFSHSESSVYLGGPVKTEGVFYLHSLGDRIPGSLEVLEGVYWGGDLESLNLIMKAEPDLMPGNVRFYIGYAGWVSEQLNDELENRSWLVAETHPEEVIGHYGPDLWQQKVQSFGKSFEPWLNFPPDPSFN